MKQTQYFQFTRQRADRAAIQEAWILQAIHHPIQERIHSDGRIQRWTWIASESKYLRVILLEDGETVHNAFFDRRFKTP